MLLRDATTLAERLMQHHGLVERGWRLVYNANKSRLGVCTHAQRTIGLSIPHTLGRSAEEVEQTLLHEIAHALLGSGVGHGPRWKALARQIGYTGERTSPSSAPLSYKWRGVCPAGHVSGMHRAPQRVKSCGECSPTFDLRFIVEWTCVDGSGASLPAKYHAEMRRLAPRLQLV